MLSLLGWILIGGWGDELSATDVNDPAVTLEEPTEVPWEWRDGQHSIRLGGVFRLDMRFFDRRNAKDTGPHWERAVLRIDGNHGDSLSWRVAPDFLGIDSRYSLDEAWVSHEVGSATRITLGLMEIPLSFEASFHEDDLSTLGYGFPMFMAGRTDFAARVEQELGDGTFYWDVVAALGRGFDALGEDREGPQFSARAVSYPLRQASDWLGGLFVGGSFAYTLDFSGQMDVITPLRNKLFLTEELEAERATFLHLMTGIDAGPVRFYYETLRGEGSPPAGSGLEDLETPNGDRVDLDQIGAWGAGLSWMVTGESYDSRPYRVRENRGRRERLPLHPLWGDEGSSGGDSSEGDSSGWGALELAIRYNNADIDRDFFNFGFTDNFTSSQEFRTFAAAVNWYPHERLRVTTQVIRIIADQRPIALNNGTRDTSWFLGFQFRF